MKLELIKKTIELLSLFAVVWISVDAIVINMAILTTLFTAVNAFPNRKLLNYSYKEQVRDIFPSIIMSMVMFLLILIFNRFVVLTDLMTIIVDIFIGSALYIGLSIMTKNKEYIHITNTLLKRYGK